jgi:hypothetical protein
MSRRGPLRNGIHLSGGPCLCPPTRRGRGPDLSGLAAVMAGTAVNVLRFRDRRLPATDQRFFPDRKPPLRVAATVSDEGPPVRVALEPLPDLKGGFHPDELLVAGRAVPRHGSHVPFTSVSWCSRRVARGTRVRIPPRAGRCPCGGDPLFGLRMPSACQGSCYVGGAAGWTVRSWSGDRQTRANRSACGHWVQGQRCPRPGGGSRCGGTDPAGPACHADCRRVGNQRGFDCVQDSESTSNCPAGRAGVKRRASAPPAHSEFMDRRPPCTDPP